MMVKKLLNVSLIFLILPLAHSSHIDDSGIASSEKLPYAILDVQQVDLSSKGQVYIQLTWINPTKLDVLINSNWYETSDADVAWSCIKFKSFESSYKPQLLESVDNNEVICWHGFVNYRIPARSSRSISIPLSIFVDSNRLEPGLNTLRYNGDIQYRYENESKDTVHHSIVSGSGSIQFRFVPAK
jgi:hypothetical protein